MKSPSSAAMPRWQALQSRLWAAVPAAQIHLIGTLVVALLAATLVLAVWYPAPYSELSGGRELFMLLVAVDLVCGPLLTLVLFDRAKPRKELMRDLGLVVLIQLAALAYGLDTARAARPLFLVHEVDRFRVITEADYLGADVRKAMAGLPADLQPRFFAGPRVVGTRAARDPAEHARVLFEALNGGRDIAQRPEFYVRYDPTYGREAVRRAKPLQRFLAQNPTSLGPVDALLKERSLAASEVRFLPVAHRQEWIILLDMKGAILGFAPGDGFGVP